MSSSRLNFLGAYVAAAALLLVLFFSFRNGESVQYSSDDSYVRNAVAESIASYGMYGIDGEPKPAVHDAWWRWVGGKIMIITGAKASAVYPILSLIFSLALLHMMIKVLTLQYPQHTVAGWVGGLMVVLSPPLLLWSMNGQSGPVGALLLLLAVIIHMSYSSEGRPLPIQAAVCIGLAATLRLEFVVIWFALFVHALVLSITNRKEVSLLASLVNGVNGLLLIGIFLAPLINWNLRVIEVPWPRSFDAAMALDSLAGSDGTSASFLGMMDAVIRSTSAVWHTNGFGAVPFVKVFAFIGLFYWMARSSKGSRDNYFLLLMVLLLTPIFHAFLVPFIGWSGAVPLYEALLPIWVLAAIAGVAALQHALDPILAKALPVFSSHIRHMIVFCLFAITPILSGGIQNYERIETEKASAEEAMALQIEAVDLLKAEGIGSETPVITDQPGRLLSLWNGPVYDITAELNPEFLYFLDGAPSADLEEIVAYVKEQGSDLVGLVVWDRVYWVSEHAESCEGLNVDEDLPLVCIQ